MEGSSGTAGGMLSESPTIVRQNHTGRAVLIQNHLEARQGPKESNEGRDGLECAPSGDLPKKCRLWWGAGFSAFRH